MKTLRTLALTAEVASLRLQGTRLVALSACETGHGESKSGEGVLGLQRALALAGAENLLLTLWSISDEDTIALNRAAPFVIVSNTAVPAISNNRPNH